MRLTILPGLTEADRQKWQRQFVTPERSDLESIWRRSQDAAPNPDDPNGCRRRIIHVIDRYDMLPTPGIEGHYDFCMTECYLWLCSTLPRDEMARYVGRLRRALRRGGWLMTAEDKYRRGELIFTIKLFDIHPEDTAAWREYGRDYQTVECTLVSDGFPPERISRESPWAVFNTGIREQGTRVPNPTIVTNMRDILQYLPAQIELGGGASIELGIPPLNFLHNVYGLYTAHNPEQFAYGDTDDLLDWLLVTPEGFYRDHASIPYARSLAAQPNDFYRLLADMQSRGLIVGPVITNNFDGMSSLVGMNELYVRRYEEAQLVPDISFHPAARSLIVVGSHADRRRVQEAATRRGLKIIYVDPESYVDHDGGTIPYPLERLAADDLLVRMPASEFARLLRKVLV